MARRALPVTLREPSRRTVVALATWATVIGTVGGLAALAGSGAPSPRELALASGSGPAAVASSAAAPVVVAAFAPTSTSVATTLPPAPPPPPVPAPTAPPAPPTTAAPTPPPPTTPPTEPPAAPPPTEPPAPSPAPAGVDAAAEQQLLDDHNSRRAAQGLPPFVRDPCLDGVARDWSARMVAADQLQHNPASGSAIERCIAWTRAAENVGFASSAAELAARFWESPQHRANIVGPFEYVGIGVVVGADGRRWATIEFASS